MTSDSDPTRTLRPVAVGGVETQGERADAWGRAKYRNGDTAWIVASARARPEVHAFNLQSLMKRGPARPAAKRVGVAAKQLDPS